MSWKSNTVIYADTDATPEAIEGAKKYIKDNNYTAEQVKIVRRESGVNVVWR